MVCGAQAERRAFDVGVLNRMRRRHLGEVSLERSPPNEDETYIVHNLFMEGAVETSCQDAYLSACLSVCLSVPCLYVRMFVLPNACIIDSGVVRVYADPR